MKTFIFSTPSKVIEKPVKGFKNRYSKNLLIMVLTKRSLLKASLRNQQLFKQQDALFNTAYKTNLVEKNTQIHKRLDRKNVLLWPNHRLHWEFVQIFENSKQEK